jgi:hypothetical protein
MTSIIEPEPKTVMDAEGNWITVLMVRTRSGKGWIETVVTAPSDRADRRKAA